MPNSLAIFWKPSQLLTIFSSSRSLLLGLLSPDKGKILIDGVDTDFKKYYWGDTIGYVPQFIYLINDTIKRNIAFGIDPNKINFLTLFS